MTWDMGASILQRCTTCKGLLLPESNRSGVVNPDSSDLVNDYEYPTLHTSHGAQKVG